MPILSNTNSQGNIVSTITILDYCVVRVPFYGVGRGKCTIIYTYANAVFSKYIQGLCVCRMVLPYMKPDQPRNLVNIIVVQSTVVIARHIISIARYHVQCDHVRDGILTTLTQFSPYFVGHYIRELRDWRYCIHWILLLFAICMCMVNTSDTLGHPSLSNLPKMTECSLVPYAFGDCDCFSFCLLHISRYIDEA